MWSMSGAEGAMTSIKVFGWYVAIALTAQVVILAGIFWNMYKKKQ